MLSSSIVSVQIKFLATIWLILFNTQNNLCRLQLRNCRGGDTNDAKLRNEITQASASEWLKLAGRRQIVHVRV